MNTENTIIGELIREIMIHGFTVELRKSSVLVRQSLTCEPQYPSSACDGQTFHGNMIECLETAVDTIRKERGRLTLAEEVANMIAEQEQHEALPPIQCGPDAACRCGCQRSLIVVRHFTFEVPWDGGKPFIRWNTRQTVEIDIQPGDVGTCPDCGLNYRMV